MEEVLVAQGRAEILHNFLKDRLSECNETIGRRKRKIFYIKLIHHSLVAVSTIGSSVASLLSSFYYPSLLIATISTVVTLSIFLSVKFNIEGKMKSLGENIQKLNIVKNELAYASNCNWQLTDSECKAILDQIGNLIV